MYKNIITGEKANRERVQTLLPKVENAKSLTDAELKNLGVYEIIEVGYNHILQQINGEVFNKEEQIFYQNIEDKILPSLEELRDNKRNELTNTIQEISFIVSACKNVYDPLREDITNIPIDLRTLITQVQLLRQRGISEIKALSTQKEAIQYVIRGKEVEGSINQLKSFL